MRYNKIGGCVDKFRSYATKATKDNFVTSTSQRKRLLQGMQKIDREEVKVLEINRLATTGKEFQMSNS